MSGKFKTRLFTADTISYLLLKEVLEVIYQEHNINEIFNKFLRIYLNIFEASFPVIYHAKHKTMLALQWASEYHVNMHFCMCIKCNLLDLPRVKMCPKFSTYTASGH
jgi:hypothetical protein